MKPSKKHEMIGKYVLIEDPRTTGDDTVQGDIEGTFDAEDAAIEEVHRSALDSFNPTTENGDLEKWGSVNYICKVVRVVRPIPHVPEVKVTMDVVDIPGGGRWILPEMENE